MMLAGDTHRFKADRHIYRFFEEYLDYVKLDDQELKNYFLEQFFLVQKEYNRFTIRMLDNLIWKFVKSRDIKFNEKENI